MAKKNKSLKVSLSVVAYGNRNNLYVKGKIISSNIIIAKMTLCCFFESGEAYFSKIKKYDKDLYNKTNSFNHLKNKLYELYDFNLNNKFDTI